jgi:glycosyltransferase involved in cell wall biosynthesis
MESYMPKRVLMITSHHLGGRYFRDIARGFSSSEITLGFVSLSGAQSPNWTHEFSCQDFTLAKKKRISFLSSLYCVFRAIQKFKPDLIQTHLFMGGIIGIISGKLFRIPVILTRHHIDEHVQVGSRVHTIIDRFSATAATHVVVCSQAAKDWLVGIEKIKSSRITVINQGFYFKDLEPTSKEIEKAKVELNFIDDNFNIICVARYSRTKGQEYLLRALSVLRDENLSIHLAFIGPGDSSWLRSLTDELNLGKMVLLSEQRSDVAACIAAADIVVHPSLVDSFSQLLVEAQAVGGPIIATDIAAAREQIINQKTGIIIPPRDVNAIVTSIKSLMSSPDLRESLSKEARSHVRQNFSLERMLQEEVDCVEKVFNEYWNLRNTPS